MGIKHIGVMTLTFQGHVTSSVTWPFDSQVALSYRQSIVNKSLSPAIFEIMGTKDIGVTSSHDLDLSRSRDVIGHVSIALGIGHFLLVVLWTQVSISNGFRDIPAQTSCAPRHNAESS